MSSIIRRCGSGYAVVSNEILRNKNLSWKAKGIMAYLLSCADGWEFTLDGICSMSGCDGMTSLKVGLKELKDAGYLVITHKQGKNGTFAGHEWFIYNELPREGEINREVEKPTVGEPPTNNTNRDNTKDIHTEGKETTAKSDFEVWYKAYPKHINRGNAERAWKKATKEVTVEELMKGLERYKRSIFGKDPEFIPHPASWLNGKRWLENLGGSGQSRLGSSYRGAATRKGRSDRSMRR